jgi:hypothetical protein
MRNFVLTLDVSVATNTVFCTFCKLVYVNYKHFSGANF